MLKNIVVLMSNIRKEELDFLEKEMHTNDLNLLIQKIPDLELKEETLCITDDSNQFKELEQQGFYVIAYLNDDNKYQDFSKARYAVESLEGVTASYFQEIYKRFRGEPWEILTTKRCIIREMTVEDVDAFYEIYKEPSITEYMDDLYQDPEQERQYTRDYIEKVYGFYGYGLWSVVEKDTGKVIGRAGLSIRPEFEDAELGFVIGVPWQRKGYAREVCEAILQYAVSELGMERVHVLVIKENTASRNLCLKLGFRYEEEVFIQNQAYQKYLYVD